MSTKRKAVSKILERRVRPRREEEWEPEPDQSSGGESGSDVGSDDGVSEEEIRGGNEQSDSDASGSEESDEESADDGPPAKVDISSISFGALARAQASLPNAGRKSKTKKPSAEAQEEERSDEPPRPRKKETIKPPKRSSKHAPQEQTSKKPVSRRREVVSLDPSINKRASVRDPRFDAALSTNRLDEIKARKAYSFLDDVRDRELADLRIRAKKTKDEGEKGRLKKEIASMESKKVARKRRDEEEKLMTEHKKKEKELVAQGKNPYYLKKSEQKRQVLTNRFEGMSKGQVDRAIERKRKKVAGRERKELDTIQRVTDRRSR